MTALLHGAAGLITGIFSSWGVGGGTLLIIFMTAIAGIEQQKAQGINLLYFIPASSAALFSHIKNKLVDKTAAVAAICTGVPAALICAFIASGMDTGILKKFFGAFLVIIGTSEFFRKGG